MNTINSISNIFFHKPIYYLSFLTTKIKEYTIEKFKQIRAFAENTFFSCYLWKFSKNNSKTTVVDKNVVESTDSTKAPVVFQEGEPISAIDLRNEHLEAERKKLQMIHDTGQTYLLKNTKRDDLRAFDYFFEASKSDFALSQCALAHMYLEGRGTEKNNLRALVWFEIAAGLNFAPAQYCLGTMYEEGRVVEKDFQRAAEYYHQAAAQNHSEAQIKICILCFNGKAAPENGQQAAIYFDLANKNMAEAQVALGTMFENGWGVEKNLTKAINWYEKAAAQHYVLALIFLVILSKFTLCDEQLAADYYQRAHRLGNVEQQQLLERLLNETT